MTPLLERVSVLRQRIRVLETELLSAQDSLEHAKRYIAQLEEQVQRIVVAVELATRILTGAEEKKK